MNKQANVTGKNNKTGYIGVTKADIGNKYFAQLRHNDQIIYIRGCSSAKEAAKAFDKLCIIYGKTPKNGFYTKKLGLV